MRPASSSTGADLQDITENKRAADALAESEQRLAATL